MPIGLTIPTPVTTTCCSRSRCTLIWTFLCCETLGHSIERPTDGYCHRAPTRPTSRDMPNPQSTAQISDRKARLAAITATVVASPSLTRISDRAESLIEQVSWGEQASQKHPWEPEALAPGGLPRPTHDASSAPPAAASAACRACSCRNRSCPHAASMSAPFRLRTVTFSPRSRSRSTNLCNRFPEGS